MFELAENTDLSFLIDKKLEQICRGLHQIILHFAPEMTITIEGSVEYKSRHSSEVALWSPDCARSSFPMQGLLGQSIATYQILPKGTLKLAFSNDDALMIKDDSDRFESYQIMCGSRYIVV